MRKLFSIITFLFSFIQLIAQTDTLQQHSISFSYDNDLFLATDRYYTQGAWLELVSPFVKRSPLSRVLLPAERDAINEYGLILQQDVFTPYTILKEGIQYGERPWCATLYLSHHLMSWDWRTKTTLETKLDIGMIGPAAGGEQMQMGIHTALDNALPRGWKHQLKNDIMLNYLFNYEEGLIVHKHFTLLAGSAVRLGTIYNDAGLGFGVKAGKVNSFFAPLTSKGFHWYMFAKTNVKYVMYNATLQGGMFNRSSVYVLSGDELSRVVLTAEGGIALCFNKLEFVYSNGYRTAEFERGLDHGWGHFALKLNF